MLSARSSAQLGPTAIRRCVFQPSLGSAEAPRHLIAPLRVGRREATRVGHLIRPSRALRTEDCFTVETTGGLCMCWASQTLKQLSGVKNRSTICDLSHDLLPPMLARSFRGLRFGFRGPCLVEVLFRGASAPYFSKVLLG